MGFKYLKINQFENLKMQKPNNSLNANQHK